MSEAKPTLTQWEVKELKGLSTGATVGFDVYRVRNPYTSRAVVEYLNPISRFRTEKEARTAIAKTLKR